MPPRPRTLPAPTEHEVLAATGAWFRCVGVRLKRARTWADNNGYTVVVGGEHARFRPLAAKAVGEIRMGDTK